VPRSKSSVTKANVVVVVLLDVLVEVEARDVEVLVDVDVLDVDPPMHTRPHAVAANTHTTSPTTSRMATPQP
jgi:hypothetical protein